MGAHEGRPSARRAASMLLLEGVALTDSGRPVLAPEELELRILEKTDAEFGERRGGLVSAPDERYRGGIAFLTTHRLIWLDQPALPSPGRSCSLHLSRVTSASPVPLKMFGSRTKRHALRCSANGGLGPSDEAGELRLAFRGESPESFARCLDDALANRAWRSERDPPDSNQSTPNRKTTTQTQTRNERGVPSFPRGRSAYDAAASRSAPPPPPPPPLGPSADQRASAAAAERDRMTSATRARHAGVGGALHRQKQEAEKDERVLGRAFTDMSEVMRRAGELVALAERFATARNILYANRGGPPPIPSYAARRAFVRRPFAAPASVDPMPFRSDFSKEKHPMARMAGLRSTRRAESKRTAAELAALTAERAYAETAADLDEDELDERDAKIAAQVLREIRARLEFLLAVGLDYLSLERAAGSLSGGEAQRIKLVTELTKVRDEVGRRGQKAPHTLYVLDEPTVGLHMSDVERLIRVLHRLVDGGHSVVVIEHDLDVIAEADWVLDLGPEGGKHGGTLVAATTPEGLVKAATHTGQAIRALLSA